MGKNNDDLGKKIGIDFYPRHWKTYLVVFVVGLVLGVALS